MKVYFRIYLAGTELWLPVSSQVSLHMLGLKVAEFRQASYKEWQQVRRILKICICQTKRLGLYLVDIDWETFGSFGAEVVSGDVCDRQIML